MASRRSDNKFSSVHDLPQLYTRPSSASLLSTLGRLKVQPAAWGDIAAASQLDEANLPRYLTSIIASSLAWIEEESVREEIWEAASSRLSERSGRTAIPSMSRTFSIPTSTTSSVSITLREPSLTADNLGHKTWLASYLLAKRLPSLVPYLPAFERGGQVIELGAGTGLVGVAIAAMFDVHVQLTDLPAIVPNLRANVTANSLSITQGSTSVGELDWSSSPDCCIEQHEAYDVVVAADPLYSPQHPAWLVATIGCVLKRDLAARVVIELPLREAYAPEIRELKSRMAESGLMTLVQGTERGFEDWEENQRGMEKTEVDCWWAVWRWRPLSPTLGKGDTID
ncbi:Protein-lysine N-methyltransferase rrg1 [Xanthoria parietina]